MRERRRARAASIRDRNAAQSRRHAFLLRQDMRSTAQAMGAPHLSAGVRTASVRRQPNRASARKRCGRSANTPHASSVWHKPARSGSKLGASPQEVRPSRRCGGSSAPWRSRPSPPSETSRA
jgi:hypothetical protein